MDISSLGFFVNDHYAEFVDELLSADNILIENIIYTLI